MISSNQLKVIILSLATILFFSSCGKEKNRNNENKKEHKIAKQSTFLYNKNTSIIRDYIINGDYKNIEKFLQEGGDVNLRCKGYLRSGRDIPETKDTDQNWTLLMIAIFSNEIQIAKLLLENKANVNAKNAVGHTALFLACAHNYENGIKLLLSHKAEVRDAGADPSGTTAFHWAIEYDRNEIILEFIKRGANVNTYSSEIDRTILTSAFFSDSIRAEVVNKIIDAGADLTFKNKDNETTLMYACSDNNIEAVKKIIAKGINVNTESKSGQTALCNAARNQSKNIELLKLLVANGAKVNTPSNRGRSPLTEAVFSRDLEKVKFLVENGAEINTKCDDFGGVSPLLEAAEWAKGGEVDEILKYLIENGADVNISNKWEESVLLEAIQTDRNYETIIYLIEKGANINQYDNDRLTPLMKAARNNSVKIAELLLENGARMDIVDNYGRTALTHAEETAERTGDASLLKLIKQYKSRT